MKSSIQYFLLLVAVLLAFQGCKKDALVEIDITAKDWKLVSLTLDGEKSIPVKQYELRFTSDSSFIMSFSRNLAGGKYKLGTDNSIEVSNYHAYTEVCCDNEFSEKLQEAFSQVNRYENHGNRLEFSGKNGNVFFE
jgi:META domain